LFEKEETSDVKILASKYLKERRKRNETKEGLPVQVLYRKLLKLLILFHGLRALKKNKRKMKKKSK
jgi:hypothetical protein